MLVYGDALFWHNIYIYIFARFDFSCFFTSMCYFASFSSGCFCLSPVRSCSAECCRTAPLLASWPSSTRSCLTLGFLVKGALLRGVGVAPLQLGTHFSGQITWN